MTSAIVVLLLVAGLVTLSIVRPGRPAFVPAAVDRDRERQLAELRAMPDYSADLEGTRLYSSSWKAASRSPSAATSRSTAAGSGWNGSHRTSPST